MRPWASKFSPAIFSVALGAAGPVILSFSLSQQAYASNVLLEPSERSFVIELNRKVEPDFVSSIAIEMDGYDVTPFGQVVDGQLQVNLQTQLAAGDHDISVLLFLPNGDIELIAEQVITVAASEITNTTSEFTSSLNTAYRLDQKPEEDFVGINELTGNGSLAWKGSRTTGKWQLEGELEALYDSVAKSSGGAAGINTSNDAWAIPNLRAGATYQGDAYHAGVSVGQVHVHKEDLLFSGFQRRGAAADLTSTEAGIQMKAFALHSEPTTRYDGDLIWPQRAMEKSSGVTASSALWGQHLVVSVGYINGETSLGGSGFSYFDEPVIYGGDSRNLAIDSQWLENSVWLHLEYASSSFDSDGIGIGEDAESDDASQAMLQFTSEGSLPAGIFDHWIGFIQYQEIGSDYFSLGNLAIPGDIETTRANWRADIQGVSLDVDWLQQKNNVDDNVFLPTQTLERSGISLNYIPTFIDIESGLWRFLGSPSLLVNYFRTNNSQRDDDALIAGYDLDSVNDEVGVTVTFSREKWNWSLQHQLIKQDDKSRAVFQDNFILYQPPSDTDNQLTSLQLSLYPSSRVSLNAFMQWSLREEVDFNNKYRNSNLGFDTQVEIIPDKLNLLLNYSYGQNRSSLSMSDFIEEDFKSHNGNLQLSWKALKARKANPGINFSLRGSYGKQDNRAFSQVAEQWSINLGVEMHWVGAGE